MDHLAVAEEVLREAGYEGLANRLRDDHLPRGVVPPCDDEGATAGRWSYDLLEKFQATFLEDAVAFGDEVHDEVADGQRHVAERQQEASWKERARKE